MVLPYLSFNSICQGNNKPYLRPLLAKQRIISSILLCAFSLLFAHSIIPHHHHEEANATHQINHHDDDHDDADNNFLGRAFSYFQHGSSGFVYQYASQSFQYSKFSIDKEAVLITQYFIGQLFKPPLEHSAHYLLAFTSSCYSASGLFRGPPAA